MDVFTRAEAEALAALQKRRMMKHTDFARALGVSVRTVRRCFARGALPGALEHSRNVILIPTHLWRLAATHGLRQVERMARAGMIAGGNEIFRR